MRLLYNDVKDSLLDIKIDKRNEIFNWGNDNSAPSLIEALISGSVTAKACTDKVSKSIYGKSFGEVGNITINKDGQSLNELLRLISREYTKHSNVFIHIGYDATLNINSLKVMPTKHCRIGKKDDKDYHSKIVVYSNWDKSEVRRVETSKFKSVDIYNPNKKVIEAQIEAAGGIRKYKGQILHIQKDSNSVYSESDLNSVLAETLLEANSQLFRSRGASKGFLNTKLLVVQPFSSEDDRDDFVDSLEKLQGAEHSGKVLLLEASQSTDALSNQMNLQDLSSSYDDKLFEYSDGQARRNICLAFGVPLGLVDISESSLFGNSGELINSMNEMLYNSQEETRDMIEEALRRLMSKWTDTFSEELKIISPIKK